MFVCVLKRLSFILVLLCSWLISAKAVPASPDIFIATMADGTTLRAQLCGDEYCHWYADEKGKVLTQKDNIFRYADSEEIRSLKAQRLSVRKARANTAIQSSFPKTGTIRIPVILVEFSDLSFTIDSPAECFSRFYNEEHYSDNGSTGSVADYYKASSFGKLNLQFDIYGPYQLSDTEEYYGGNTSNSSTKNAQELVKEAVRLAYASGVDFSQYDSNNDSQIDNISIITAGHNEAEGGGEKCIWPHQSSVWNSTRIGNVNMGSYLMISELRGSRGSLMANIGTYCHEFGHVLGLPDLYDTTDKSDGSSTYTVGTWDVMCSGPYNNSSRTPPLYSAFERFVTGWLTPEQITTAGNLTLEPIETSNTACLIASAKHNMQPLNPSPSEYFLIENRQRVGWDSVSACLPGTGLLISHITYSYQEWNNNTFNNSTPLGYDIVEAYNSAPSASSATDTYPGTANVTSWTPQLNSGQSLTQYALHNIYQRNNGNISFTFGDADNAGFVFTPEQIDTLQTTFEVRAVEYSTAKAVISINGFTTPSVTYSVSGRFQFSLDSTTWHSASSSVRDSVSLDEAYSRIIFLRYNPARQRCTPETGALSVFSADSSVYAGLPLLGLAPRPVYITPVDTISVNNITETSFRATWNEVEDAEYYKVNLYEQTISGQDTAYNLIYTRETYAPTKAAIFSNLKSGSVYAVSVQAAEQKSCRENTTAARWVTARTLSSLFGGQVPIILLDNGSYALLLNGQTSEQATLSVFASDGSIISSVEVAEGTDKPVIPTEQLQHGKLYLIKLYSATFTRKSIWGKLLY